MKISIIIPIYNVEPYIEECLLSVVNQTMTDNVECILVDDCGSDNSIAIAESFVNSYEGNIKFTIIHHEKNSGLSAARNSGIKAAKGEYLFFFDSDDTITPDCMEIMYSFIQKYGKVDLVQGSFYESEEERKTENKYKFPEYSQDRKQIKYFLLTYAGDIVGAQSRLIKRELIILNNLFFKEGIIHEDNYWTFFLAKYITSVAFCSKRTYYHRHNPNSITNKINREKEIFAYKTIITDLSASIDSFLPGRQKEFILETLLTVLDAHFYDNFQEKNKLIKIFTNQDTFIEKFLLKLYFKVSNRFFKTKLLHLLIRIYKRND